jgi:hypothetical protein
LEAEEVGFEPTEPETGSPVFETDPQHHKETVKQGLSAIGAPLPDIAHMPSHRPIPQLAAHRRSVIETGLENHGSGMPAAGARRGREEGVEVQLA